MNVETNIQKIVAKFTDLKRFYNENATVNVMQI